MLGPDSGGMHNLVDMLHGSEKRRGLDARWIGRTDGSALVAGLWGREKKKLCAKK